MPNLHATDGSVRSKGTMYFTMHPHGQQMTGRWVGLSHDGDTLTGLGALAHDEGTARRLVQEGKATP